MFGRVTIRLGIGPYSSFYWIFIVYMRTLAVVNLDDAERFKTKVDTCTMFASFSCSSDFNEHTKIFYICSHCSVIVKSKSRHFRISYFNASTFSPFLHKSSWPIHTL